MEKRSNATPLFVKEESEDKKKKQKVIQNDGFANAEEDQAKVSGFIHVRARRGQATDSHSLAERARRERIREKLQLIQSLVPGCDKITGKAQILDEIIRYVQSLQNQVECLAFKLASANSFLNGYDFDPLMDPPALDQDDGEMVSGLLENQTQSLSIQELDQSFNNIC